MARKTALGEVLGRQKGSLTTVLAQKMIPVLWDTTRKGQTCHCLEDAELCYRKTFKVSDDGSGQHSTPPTTCLMAANYTLRKLMHLIKVYYLQDSPLQGDTRQSGSGFGV